MTSYPLTNQDRLSAIFYIALVGEPFGRWIESKNTEENYEHPRQLHFATPLFNLRSYRNRMVV